ncbi:hypothetical protein V8F20_002489 [Naviculisporaceae sp. PSN 640]
MLPIGVLNHVFLLSLLLPIPATALLLANSPGVIESTPQLIAAQDYFHLFSSTPNKTSTFIRGGVGELVLNSAVDLAGNAETQSLRHFANHTSQLRLIYTICEVTYRLIVPKSRNITSLAGLRGKNIGTFLLNTSSSAYFVEKLLGTVGLHPNFKDTGYEPVPGDYKVTNGTWCTKLPCGEETLTAKLLRGEIDAIGAWEPTVEITIQALGGLENVVIFKDENIYREILSLHSRVDKLSDPETRKDIVGFVRALRMAARVFQDEPEKVYERVAKAVDVDVDIIKAVWADSDWRGGLREEELLDTLVEEDKWVARMEKRAPLERETLRGLIDGSVLEEAEELDAAERTAEK